MQQGRVFAPKATLPLLLSLVSATLSSAEEAGEDAGENVEGAADADGAGDADEEGGDGLEEDMEGDGAEGEAEVGELNPATLLKDMDKDEDGFLSLNEIVGDEQDDDQLDKEIMTKAFAAADVDKDGKLSIDELPVAMKEWEKMVDAASEPNEEMEHQRVQRRRGSGGTQSPLFQPSAAKAFASAAATATAQQLHRMIY
eukprot:CAMPEP_0172688372 /NCGR_PEP_ID=MMETSP1074-20121228/22383_1 /TAXON_ID=2916 /ORGANISM="Ceratium fusus, Strain PA161109" /LENGTH=198 /DNA_ID=CAMNT_0013508007 /DNA_START=64 /DNA_END=658 /DNA_ORIENTATION=+